MWNKQVGHQVKAWNILVQTLQATFITGCHSVYVKFEYESLRVNKLGQILDNYCVY